MKSRNRFAMQFDRAGEQTVILTGATAHAVNKMINLYNQGVDQRALICREQRE
jgi:hypothetical protein